MWSLVVIPIQLSSPSPLHPGIYVSFDLLAWTTVLAVTLIYYLLMEPYFSGDGYSCEVSWPCNGKAVAITEQVGGAFALLSV